jgi:hypothetical protein
VASGIWNTHVLHELPDDRKYPTRWAAIVEEFDGHTWMRDPEGNDFCVTDAPRR